MSNIPSKAKTIIEKINESINRDDDNGSSVDYGFWWGRSGQIPYTENPEYGGRTFNENDWNPHHIESFDMKNTEHYDFAKNELQLAIDRGVKDIGLDAFTNMKVDQQFEWMKEMAGDDVKFWEESVMSDYLHTELSLFLQPCTTDYVRMEDINKEFTSRPILADYLNPGAEIIVHFLGVDKNGTINKGSDDNEKELLKHEDDDNSYIERLMNFGFTPPLTINDGDINKIPNLK